MLLSFFLGAPYGFFLHACNDVKKSHDQKKKGNRYKKNSRRGVKRICWKCHAHEKRRIWRSKAKQTWGSSNQPQHTHLLAKVDADEGLGLGRDAELTKPLLKMEGHKIWGGE